MRSEIAGHGVDPERLSETEERIALYKEALQQKERAEAALREQSQGQDLSALENERAQVSAKAKAIEEELFQMGGYLGDLEALRAEAREIEAALAGGPRPKPAAVPAPFEAPAPIAPAPLHEPSGSFPLPVEDHVQAILKTARDLFLCDLDQVIQRVQARAAQYLYALSDERYARLQFGPQGEVAVHEMASGIDVPYGQLTPGDRDLVYLSVKLTLAEVAARQARLPIVLERALDPFPDKKHPLFVRMLQFLGSLTQVLLMTSKPGLLPAAQHQTSL